MTGSILNLTYGYDPNGNITSRLDAINLPGGEILESPGTYSYQTGTNKLSHIEGTPSMDYGYDSNGNITTEDGWTYVYDLSNQLVRALEGGNQVGEYTFNGAGQRIKKVTQTETRIFHCDLWGHIIAETNQTGQVLAEYIYLRDQLLTMIKPGEQAYYFHNDHLGTPQVLTDAAQTVVWKAMYTPFGEAVTSIATVENPFRFPGQYYDAETGLHYNYFRHYNPPIGRYLAPDPIGLRGGINLYPYVAGNPLRWIDPFGLAWGDWQYVTATIEGTTAQGLRSTTTYNFNTNTDLFVALPSEGLQGSRVEIEVNGGGAQVPVGDVGPWNGGHTTSGNSLDDPYWETNRRPQAECGTDLRGRQTNGAGIDISDALARQLGLTGTTQVRWRGLPPGLP